MPDLPEELTAYVRAHRIRQHGMENGYVEKTGKRVKKWRGYYHDYRQNPDGTQKRIKLKTILGPVSEMSKAQAEDALRLFIRRRNSLPVAETPKATVASLCDDYLQLREGDWQGATRDTNASILTLIKAALGERVIEAVQPEDIKLFINSLPKRTWKTPTGRIKTGCSESQADKCITYVRAIFDLATERAAKRGVLFLNPARSKAVPLTVPVACRKPDKTILPPQELPRLLQQLNEADQLAVWLAAISLRPGEAFAIQGGDVGPRCIRIEDSLSRDRELKDTKTHKHKYVFVPAELDSRIHRWLAEHNIGPRDFLFVNEAGRPMSVGNFLKRRLRPAAKRAGIATLDVDFQMLRRSFGTLGVAIGGDLKSIQAQMGHARPDMTLLEYAQPVDDARCRLVQRIEDILLGKEPMPVDLTVKLGSRLVN
jgi:integrase